ncbi:MAG: hypothetical protein EZS28_040187, partial [Streblomastix strix]
QVNGSIVFAVPIRAEVIPISFELTQYEICVSYPPSFNGRVAPVTIYIQNPGNNTTEFEWERDHSIQCQSTGLYMWADINKEAQPIGVSLLFESFNDYVVVLTKQGTLARIPDSIFQFLKVQPFLMCMQGRTVRYSFALPVNLYLFSSCFNALAITV